MNKFEIVQRLIVTNICASAQNEPTASEAPFKKNSRVCPGRPEGTEGPEQPENAEHPQDLGPARHGHHDVDQGDEDQEPVQDVPAAPEVGLLPQVQAHGHHLQR